MGVEVPVWWLYASGIYFVLSLLWTIGLCVGLLIAYKKLVPLLKEGRTQMEKVTTQAKTVATKASNTASMVQTRTQGLIGNTKSAGSMVTKQAQTLGTLLTVAMVTAKAIRIVKKFK